ncbi:hypothetical protein MAF45_09470 [Mesosutterella sp. OilRF-GAM-744-9]|uniref:Mu-like prophage tail protein gpP n=1 Tax=Mesosutterella porci TaxID=2915351 RepID=A0ABS9MSR3_9BURK|nr:hypothetical protein [Mesosutterella sp. oilRF-744-WT-GAM-9]MCG5031666.1 hypothetical protein [Mesosutterella sp. oilRF-744-WT-GAM-9]
MTPENEVTLYVNGEKYLGWTSVQIEVSVNSLVRACQLGAARTSNRASLCEGIEEGLEAVVKIGSDTLLTGFIVNKTISYTHERSDIQITIKSKTVDLDECMIPPGKPHQWKRATVSSVIKTIAGYYGIEVVDNGLAKNVRAIDFSTHETIGSGITKLLKDDSLLINDDEFGNLVVCGKTQNGEAHDQLIYGQNILTGSRAHDISKVFKTYVVIGQGTDPESKNSKPANSISEQAENSDFPRNRVSVTEQSGNRTRKELKSRAEHLMANSIGNADVLTYQVQGWRQSNGDLWKQNMKVRIKDPMLGINQRLLVSKITYRLDKDGSTTTMTLKDPSAFTVTDLPDVDKGKKTVAKKVQKGTTFLAKAGSGRL